MEERELQVKGLGDRVIPSPLGLSTVPGDEIADYVHDDARVLSEIETRAGAFQSKPLLFEKAGPREWLFFDPKKTGVGIVTCGGLCPGINNVVRSMVLELHYKYGVGRVFGFRYGFEGLTTHGLAPSLLMPNDVLNIHRHGGSFLGLSRGKQDPAEMVDMLQRYSLNILFTIGGDGTLRGTHAISEEIEKRNLKISVIAVPKTIDNDVPFVDQTFGYESAVEVARQAVDAAHTEAIGAYNGIGIVKLMGRDAGFIAAAATLASREVNYCLIPEVRFELEGAHGLLLALERRLDQRHHAVIVVAEGCGAMLPAENAERDASGNIRYASAESDIGPRLRDAITKHFKEKKIPVSVKYIDPSYMIRSVPANANDSIFCDALARHAVHAGMAGKTDVLIGRQHGIFVHIPLTTATSTKKRVSPDDQMWLAVTEATGQPKLHG